MGLGSSVWWAVSKPVGGIGARVGAGALPTRGNVVVDQQFSSWPNEAFPSSGSAFTGFHRAVFDCGRAILVSGAGFIGMVRGSWGKGSG